MKQLKETKVLDVSLTNTPMEDILEYIFSFLENSSKKLSIVTPNPEIVMYANSHEYFKNTLNRAEIKLADGVGLVMAAQLLGKGRVERISGVDFMEMLCKESVRKGVNTGFLGGRSGVALETAQCLQKKYPGLKISFIGEEWESGEWIPEAYQEKVGEYLKEEKLETRNSKLDKTSQVSSIKHLASHHIDILFVAFGFPKQEEWILSHSEYPFRVGMGVGGAFDYLSGSVSRAPLLFRKFGFEWLYRLLRQPWRAKRQFALLRFIGVVLKERFFPTL